MTGQPAADRPISQLLLYHGQDRQIKLNFPGAGFPPVERGAGIAEGIGLPVARGERLVGGLQNQV